MTKKRAGFWPERRAALAEVVKDETYYDPTILGEERYLHVVYVLCASAQHSVFTGLRQHAYVASVVPRDMDGKKHPVDTEKMMDALLRYCFPGKRFRKDGEARTTTVDYEANGISYASPEKVLVVTLP